MKALLFQLIRSLEFELDAQVGDVGRKSVYVYHHSSPLSLARIIDRYILFSIVTRPYLISQKEKGNQLPMIIRPINH